MRFVGFIKKDGNLVARASVDDAEGETPERTAEKGMDQMLRDMRRNNQEMARPTTDAARRDAAGFDVLNKAYGDVIVRALADRREAVHTGFLSRGDEPHATLHAGMVVRAEGEKGMTCHFEAKSDEWIAETDTFLDRVMQRA